MKYIKTTLVALSAIFLSTLANAGYLEVYALGGSYDNDSVNLPSGVTGTVHVEGLPGGSDHASIYGPNGIVLYRSSVGMDHFFNGGAGTYSLYVSASQNSFARSAVSW